MIDTSQGVADVVELATSSSPSTAVLVSAVILGVGALRLAEAVISRYLPSGRAAEPAGLEWTDEDQRRLRVLYEMHNRYRADGSPAWYSQDDPVAAAQMAQDLRKIAEAQRDTLRIVERLDSRLENAIRPPNGNG